MRQNESFKVLRLSEHRTLYLQPTHITSGYVQPPLLPLPP